MTFRLYRSNRVEQLGKALLRVVQRPLSSPFARECIVVQGPGMERWLASELAKGLGVWANPWFPFPRAVVELLLDAVLEPLPEEPRWYAPDALSWRIARVLPELLEERAFAAIASYLANDRDNERLMTMAGELAHAFDQCMVYRPELLLAWEAGPHDDVRAQLWRRLVRDAPTPHLASRIASFHRALDSGQPLRGIGAACPERISLFGISALPPAFLSVLARAASQLDVHFFLLTPSAEYWGDFDRKLVRGHDLHALLATLGKVGRDLVEQLAEIDAEESDEDLFVCPTDDTMLAGLQADLCTLTARGHDASAGKLHEQPRCAHANDQSLAVHVCHSELRELEVLRDQLRARLESDPTLEPHDIVVLTPSIDRYAAFIHAVFARNADDDPSFIPYHVADRKSSQLSPVSDAFLRLLELVRSRLGLSDVLDLLHRPCVRMRFGLAEDELDRIEDWLREAGARWAIDAEHRASFGQPKVHENTLRFALDRLLVGYAAKDGERRDYRGTLPYCDAEGHDALPLGGLARFLTTLFDAVQALKEPRPASAWNDVLRDLLTRMISDEGDLATEHLALRSAIAELAERAEAANMTAPLSLLAFARELAQRLDQRRASGHFLAGGITFCEHVPMRAIPFRVVCMVGMDDESFPRRGRRSSFDVLAENPRIGDRTLRDDDRQIFLEALLSARDALWFSYVGRSAKDDTPRPPSVLLDQLLSLIDRHFVEASDGNNLLLGFTGSVAKAITHVHALHRFDPRYFKEPRDPVYFSYDKAALQAASALGERGREARPFVPAPLPSPKVSVRELPLDLLVRFYRAPQRKFLEERLGVFLPRDIEEIPDREPTAPDGLERYRLGDDLLREMMEWPREERKRVLTQEGRLPPGTLGEVSFADIERNVTCVHTALTVEEPETQVLVRLALSDTFITGRMEGVAGKRCVERIVSVARGKHLFSAWIRHLALCASTGELYSYSLVSRDNQRGAIVHTFTPVPDARAMLEELVQLRKLGLRTPLPFFANAAYEAACVLAKGKSDDEARTAFEKEVTNKGLLQRSDLDDSAVQQVWSARELARPASLCARDEHGQDLDSLALVKRLMLPMLAHLAKEDEP